MTQRTYGIFATSIKGITIKDDKDNGWVADLKQQFARHVKPERLLTLDNIAVVKNAARNGGEIKLEVTPMLDGEPLQPVLMPVNLRGNIAIDEDGAVTCTTRVTFDMPELSGLGIDALLSSALCLECKVSDQPTLEESIQTEIQKEKDVQTEVNQLVDDVADFVANRKEQATNPEDEEPLPPYDDGTELKPVSLTADDLFDGDDMPFGPSGAAD